MRPARKYSVLNFKAFIHVVFALCLGSALYAQEKRADTYIDDRIETFVVGIFCIGDIVSSAPSPGLASGQIMHFDTDPILLSTSQRVGARLGTSFGIQLKLQDPEDGGMMQIRLTHPPFKGKGTTEQNYESALFGTFKQSEIYTFDYPYELAIGEWTFEALVDGELFFRTVFDIVPPNEAPPVTGNCGPPQLS